MRFQNWRNSRINQSIAGDRKISLKKKLAKIYIVTIIDTVVAINTQFSIAVHIMAGLAYGCGGEMTSGHLAQSVNTSPSFVRRVLAKLSKAGLVKTATGKAGACWLVQEPKNISLLDIYEAVDAPKAFAIHHYTEQKSCTVSCHIKQALELALGKTQKAMEGSLAEISLAQVVAQVKPD
jgi:Rrf2 family protein